MKNENLIDILNQFPDDCEILVLNNDYKTPVCVSVEYYKEDDFDMPRIVIEVEN